MADKTLNIRIQLRNATAAEWVEKDPVLLKGEMGIESDTAKTKIGDGESKWSALKYSGVDEETIKGIINNNRDKVTALTLEEGKTDDEMLATISNPVQGDMAVVENEFTTGKISRTAYVYNGTGWAAFDGNYSADNVYFDDDLLTTKEIGYITLTNGMAKVPAKGQNLTSTWETIFVKEQEPSVIQPSVKLTVTGKGTYEIGTKVNFSYSASLDAGSYTFGPATGVAAQSWSVKCDGVDTPLTTATGTFENIVAEASAKKITATATHNAGAVPKTNKDNDYADAQIKAGSKSTTSTDNVVGARYMFWGPMTSDDTLTSANIRALANNKASGTGALTTFGAGAGAKKVVVAVPAGRKITKVVMPSALNADVTALFVKQGTQVDVEGANGYTAAKYDVYVYQPASIDAGETYTVTIG